MEEFGRTFLILVIKIHHLDVVRMLLGLVDRDESHSILSGQENDGFQRAVGDNLLENLLFANHLEQILRLD